MHPLEAFIRHPVKVAVGVLLVVLFGVIGMLRMPMQLTPEVNVPTITVQTRWPGASPQEIEREIVQEQEDQLQSVQGLSKLSSESTDSQGTITLEFQVGTDMREALVQVNSRLAQVPEYPADADEPVVSTSDASDRPMAWFILSPRLPTEEEIAEFQQRHPQLAEAVEPARRVAVRNQGLAAARLYRLAAQRPELKEVLSSELLPPDIRVGELRKFAEDYIETRFERVEGVSNSNVFGGQDPELQVVVDPNRLAARGLTIMDVRRALAAGNKDTSGGDFYDGKRRWVVRTMGQYRSISDVENQIVAIHQGQPVLVRDIVALEDGVRIGYKKPDGLVRRFGRESISVNAQRSTGANVLDVMEGLRQANRELNDGLLRRQKLQLTQVYDETEYIYAAIGLVNQNIVIGGLLTVLVLLLFLRSGRSALVISLAIPVSIIGTFMILNLLGRSLNVISLAGLAFAVGMLVDNAVVVLENIFRHYQAGMAPFAAAVRGAREVWGAIIASTLTTLAVFLPVLFVAEEAGQLFRDIALAISAAVGLSLLVSVTVIPTVSARIFSKTPRDDSRPQRRPGPLARFSSAFVEFVLGLNAWSQRSWRRELLVIVTLVGASLIISVVFWPKVEYLPTGNRNLIFGILLPPPGYNIDELMKMGELVEQDLQPYWDAEPDSEEARELDYPVIGDWFYVARGRSVFIGLRAADPKRAWELVPLVQRVRERLPGTFVVANQSSLFERGLGAGRSIDIEITGPDLKKLVGLGGGIMGQLMNPQDPLIPGAQARPVPSLDLSSPEIHVVPKRVPAADMGMSTTDLGYTVDALIDGAYASDYYIGGDKIDLVIFGDPRFADVTQDIEMLPVAAPNGPSAPVPLSALADVTLSSGPEQVNRRERQRAITISVNPPAEVSLQEAIDVIQAKIIKPLQESGQLEQDGQRYVITLSGTADKLRDTWNALRWNVLLALLITYLLMAALFESWFYPLVIIFSVPLAAVGGVLGLHLLNLYRMGAALAFGERIPPPQTLDVLTMLGFVILIGTAVNNAILIVHQALNYMREEGMTPRRAVLESVRTRIRPIFMTTTTTVFGLAPLVLFRGAGSELYRGLGSVVLGGLAVSTLFTLVLAPTMFSFTMSLVGSRLAGGEPAEGAPRQAAEHRPLQPTDPVGAARSADL